MAIHYENAPITEALIDIRAQVLTGESGLKVLESLYDRVKNEYPKKRKRIYIEGEFSLDSTPPQSRRSWVLFFRLQMKSRFFRRGWTDLP